MAQMWNDAYLESRVLSADPLELIAILYEGALGAVEQARRHLAAGSIPARSAAVSKAVGILGELAGLLDHSKGGELSSRLAALYDYMQHRLLEANFLQIEEPLAEVAGLLRVLSEGWCGIKNPRPAVEPPPRSTTLPWGAAMIEEPVAAGYGTQSWSL
jgi:flagellar protein FliS